MENITFSSEIITLLDDLGKRLGVAIDWTSENVMPWVIDLYERFISYKIALNCIAPFLFILFTILLIIFLKKYWKNRALFIKNREPNLYIDINDHGKGEMSFFAGGIIILLCVAILISLLFACFSIGDLIQLIFVPEVYMFEYISSYIGS